MKKSNRITIDELLRKMSNTDNAFNSSKSRVNYNTSRTTTMKSSSRTHKSILDYMYTGSTNEINTSRVKDRLASIETGKHDEVFSGLRERPEINRKDGVKKTNISEWWLSEIDNFVELAEGYIIDVKYDGELGKAVVLVYDNRNNTLYRWIDRTNHKPYFLTDKSPDELKSEKLDIEKIESFRSFEIVTKFHPIKRKYMKYTKIVVEDPLTVKTLRSRLEARGIDYWEADIKYHHNYIYDNLIVPGMPYKLDNKLELKIEYTYNIDDYINEVFYDASEETRKLAKEWFILFEHQPVDIPRIAIDIEVYTPEEGRIPDVDKAEYPIISIGLADTQGLRKVLVLGHIGLFEEHETDLEDLEIEIFDDERSMLLEFFRIIEKYPVVLTFNGDNFDLPYIYNRMLVLGVESDLIPMEFHKNHVSFKHSIHVDLHKLFDIRALQVYAFGNRYREKSLDSVASALLGVSKIELPDIVTRISLEKLIIYNIRDADLTLKLTTFNNNLVWNLVQLLMRISKLGLEDVTRTQVLGWIKSLMNWEHRKRKWLIPNKNDLKIVGGAARSKAIIKEKKYEGAIVLEPPQGIFFNIVVLDFASLYPSIISNWNLSYETVNNPYCSGGEKEVPIVKHKICTSIKGISSELIGLLRDFRVRIYKKKAKQKDISSEERAWYDTVQSAMKVYINASYGVFGNDTFHLYSLPVAESVTAIGRNILTQTLKKAEEMDIIIIYGDTDSLFVWDPPKNKLEELILYVREKYGLELELDKEFAVGVFSGLKKNYIGVTRDGNIVIKGMVGKKSNTPEFIKKEFSDAVKILAKLRSPDHAERIIEELREHINRIYRKLRNKEYMLDELAIRVMLSKDISKYTKNTPQHVKAAMLLKRYGVDVSKGSIISYVKTRDRLGVKPVKLAKLNEVDISKYMDYIKSVFEQILLALGIKWEELSGTKRLEQLL